MRLPVFVLFLTVCLASEPPSANIDNNNLFPVSLLLRPLTQRVLLFSLLNGGLAQLLNLGLPLGRQLSSSTYTLAILLATVFYECLCTLRDALTEDEQLGLLIKAIGHIFLTASTATALIDGPRRRTALLDIARGVIVYELYALGFTTVREWFSSWWKRHPDDHLFHVWCLMMVILHCRTVGYGV